MGKNGKGIYVCVHPKSMKKFKDHLREYSSRRRCQSIRPSLEKIKVYVRGWMNYYGTASMKNQIDEVNGWLYHRIRMCIWKQWKLPKTKKRHLINLGIPEYYACMAADSRKGYWRTTQTSTVNRALSLQRLCRLRGRRRRKRCHLWNRRVSARRDQKESCFLNRLMKWESRSDKRQTSGKVNAGVNSIKRSLRHPFFSFHRWICSSDRILP